jgi:membrane protein YqaA with SNARE-associated domain
MDRDRNPLRRLYRWTESLAERPSGTWSLFGLAFAEASFFPVPPDVLLLALGLGRPRRSFWFAAVCTAGSVIGGLAGYAIGIFLFESVGRSLLELYGALEGFEHVRELYRRHDAWVVFISGFTPIPYKVFTIGAGACSINVAVFVLASLLGRAGRFFLVAAALWFFGPPIKPFLEKYFNLLSIIFVLALLGGFVLVRFVL